MKLVPAGEPGATTTSQTPGRTVITLSPEKRQLIGLRTSPVEKRPLTETVHATGTVTHDETRFTRVAPRFGGWVKSVSASFTGAPVRAGEVLFTAYSPEVFAAESDFLVALQNVRRLTNTAAAEHESATRLLDAARRRLALLEIGDTNITALEQRGTATDQLPFHAPFSGHVITRNATAGGAFTAGESLFEIADLEQLWVQASVAEPDLPRIKIGQKAWLNFPNLNNTHAEGTVTFISPHFDAQTRRGQVRVELANPRLQFKPDMWAEVELGVASDESLAVPASAVLDTGARYIVFVEGEKDHLEPREVEIGTKTDDYWQVLGGLKEGDRVVTRALFLVDSESQLKAAIAGMGATSEHKH